MIFEAWPKTMKRSLGPSRWFPPPKVEEPKRPGFTPLQEGPVVNNQMLPESQNSNSEQSRLKPYQRGSLNAAVHEASLHAERCREHISKRARADTAHGPHESRLQTWATLAQAAGFRDPFEIDSNMIFHDHGSAG